MISKLFGALSWLDSTVGLVAPFWLRVCGWGILCGILSMWVYERTSPQARIRQLRDELRQLRKAQFRDDLEFDEYLRISKANLLTSLKYVGLAIGPALLSSVPVLFVAAWLFSAHQFVLPEPATSLAATPLQGTEAQTPLQPQIDTQTNQLTVHLAGTTVYAGPFLAHPTAVVTKRPGWHWLLAEPAGYLADDAPCDALAFSVLKKRMLPGLPDWAAGWELPFFLMVCLAAIAYKIIRKIH